MISPTEKYCVTVPPELHGSRLDACLPKLAPDYSRVQFQQMIQNGELLLNGTPALQKRTPVSVGDRIEFRPPPEATMTDVVPEEIPLDILYEDDALLVINKSAGMVVHPAAGNYTGTVVNALLGRSKELADEFEDTDPVRPGIVHRLDKDTSGCLVIAKTGIAMRKLTRMFADRQVHKLYAAIVAPAPRVLAGEIKTQIGRHPVNRKKMAVVAKDGRDAVTIFKVAKSGKIGSVSAALLHVRILTGRTHQIRVHMAHYGSPVIGDGTYGGNGRIPAPRQMLHAWKISFLHPLTGEELSFESPFPPDFQEYADRIREN